MVVTHNFRNSSLIDTAAVIQEREKNDYQYYILVSTIVRFIPVSVFISFICPLGIHCLSPIAGRRDSRLQQQQQQQQQQHNCPSHIRIASVSLDGTM